MLPDGSSTRSAATTATQGDNGNADRVVFVGWRDPLDVSRLPFGSCEIVEVTDVLPAGWPYGPVQR